MGHGSLTFVSENQDSGSPAFIKRSAPPTKHGSSPDPLGTCIKGEQVLKDSSLTCTRDIIPMVKLICGEATLGGRPVRPDQVVPVLADAVGGLSQQEDLNGPSRC